ncbi:hypothetical protein EYF80_023916 [Liparis tanakae]|uniref:Uncharacterized protein n=1 Tax=Liparis tanakae TaxID=230148 RepID=A0A4Z2HJH7_9TELE|nr:hypothetical protein EYF80_023916 [Liparis tanakae]
MFNGVQKESIDGYHGFSSTLEMAVSQCACVDTLYGGEFERGGVEGLDPLGLHRDVGFLQAVFLQQVVHLQEMLPKVLGQKLDLRWSRRRQRRPGPPPSHQLLQQTPLAQDVLLPCQDTPDVVVSFDLHLGPEFHHHSDSLFVRGDVRLDGLVLLHCRLDCWQVVAKIVL